MRRSILGLTVAVCALVGAACSSITLRTPESRRYFAEAVTESWSDYSRLQAARLMEKYGPPDKVGHAELVWSGRAPWSSIRVWDVTPYYDSSLGDPNLEQAVYYPVIPGQRGALKALPGKVRASRDGTELSARGASEPANLLSINLAEEVLSGRRTPEEAADFHESTLDLSVSGKSSPYLERLLFTPRTSGRAQ